MKTSNLLTLLALGLATTFVSCKKDDPNPDSAVKLSFNTSTTSGTLAQRVSLANSINFTSGTINMSSIQFEAETDETDSVEVDIEQAFSIDFATGATTPDLSFLTFPTGTYSAVEVEMELNDDGAVPAIVLNGTFVDANGTSHPLRFEFNSAETFEVEKEGAITFNGGESVIAQVNIAPKVWFTGVSTEALSSATKNVDGVIVISSTSNSTIFNTVADGLDLATEVEVFKN